MDSHFDPHDAGALTGVTELYAQDAEPVGHRAPPRDAPTPGLSEAAWFHILWFSAAMLGMPALIAVLTLLF